jgi:prepilin-type N-terminal cleavage/methylation domain-containing protein
MKRTGMRGYTLVELLVVIVMSAIIIISLFRLFNQSVWSYSLQNQLMDMHQNANYIIQRLTDEIAQAGGGFSPCVPAIFQAATDSSRFNVRENLRNGSYVFKSTFAGCTSFTVDMATGFWGADSIIQVYRNTATPSSFSKITGVDTVNDIVRIAPQQTFNVGDTIYPFINRLYYQVATNVCMNNASTILAENIDSLKIIFLDSVLQPTHNWSAMRSAKISVTSKTEQPDQRYQGSSDKRHRVTLDMTLRLKAKI